MNMKAMMFAGVGLFVAMVPTTMWISSDMRGIHAREQARLQRECEDATASRSTSAATAAPPADSGVMPVDASSADAPGGTTPASDDPCAKLDGAKATAKATGAGTTDPDADPNAYPSDPNAGPVGGAVDPNTGMPVDPAVSGGTSYGGDTNSAYGGDTNSGYGGDTNSGYGGDTNSGGTPGYGSAVDPAATGQVATGAVGGM